MENQEKKPRRGLQILFVIIILVLAAAVGVLLSQKHDMQQQYDQDLETTKTYFEQQLTTLQGEFGNLQTDNDSLRNLAVSQQENIEKLLKMQANNVYKIKMYQKELASLRKVLKSYIVQVDSLNTRNLQLTAEKQQLSKSLSQERAQSARLSEDRERLTSTVQKAQILSISDIRIQGLTKRNGETMRVRRLEKLKCCFTVRENQVAEAGEKTFYIAIINPDKKVLSADAAKTLTTSEGETISYTDSRKIDYENKDIEVCIFADGKQLAAGNYIVNVYCEGYMLGTYNFSLK